jgi:hypothetical protein
MGLHYIHQKGQGRHFTTEACANRFFNIQQWTKNVQKVGTLLLWTNGIAGRDIRKFGTNVLAQSQPGILLESISG